MGNLHSTPLVFAECCADDGSRFNGEFNVPQASRFTPNDDEDGHPDLKDPKEMVSVRPEPICTRATIELGMSAFTMPAMLSDRPSICDEKASTATRQNDFETLSYTPVCFDEGVTFDYERSHQRYSKIVVHSTRARTQRRSQIWEEWMRAAVAGRSVTLLCGFTDTHISVDGLSSVEPQGLPLWPPDQEPDEVPPQEKSAFTVDSRDDCPEHAKRITMFCRVPASYALDRSCTVLSLTRAESVESDDASAVAGNGTPSTTATTSAATESTERVPLNIRVASIQVICPATDFMMLFEQVNTHLTEQEKARAVLIQYITEDDVRKRVCFLEESESAKDCFVQALTALWLETRNDHSMWF